MIEIFKTNVQKISQAGKLIRLLPDQFPGSKVNFNLKDRDKICRVAGADIILERVACLIKRCGFNRLYQNKDNAYFTISLYSKNLL